MGITHVLRGEDLLSSTPAPDRALRGADRASASPRDVPVFGHLPLRHGRGQQEALQARPAVQPVPATATRGFLPEGLLNYLALLGWAIADDRDVFSLDELVAAFDIARRQPQPGPLRPEEGRGDQRRRTSGCSAPEDFTRPPGAVPAARPACCRREPSTAPTPSGSGRVAAAGRRSGSTCSREARRCSASCSGRRRARRSPTTRARSCRTTPPQVLDAALGALEPVARLDDRRASRRPCGPRSSTALGLKPRLAFGPVRVAVTGRRISPPLFESLELLGRDSTAGPPARRCGRRSEPDGVRAPPRSDALLLDVDDTLVDTRAAMVTAGGAAAASLWPTAPAQVHEQAGVALPTVTPAAGSAATPRARSSSWRCAPPGWLTSSRRRVRGAGGRARAASSGRTRRRSATRCGSSTTSADLLEAAARAAVPRGPADQLRRPRHGREAATCSGSPASSRSWRPRTPSASASRTRRAFLHACERMGSEPARTAYVGDDLVVDALAAREAGLTGIWLDRRGTWADGDVGVPVVRSWASWPDAAGTADQSTV